MAFVRDKDAATRGVNAVAAFDMTSRRGRALEARKQRLMMKRDRAMSAVAKGGLGSLGAIDSARLGVRPALTLSPGGNVESPSGGLVGQVGSGRVPQPRPPTPTGGGGGSTFYGTKPASYPTRLVQGGFFGTRPVPGAPTTSTTDPGLTTSVGTGTNPVIVSGSAPSSGGGGGGGGGSGGSGGGGGDPDPADLDTGPSSPPADDSSSTMKTALLIGGGLLAAYLIFGKDD
jgi:hypothetical protein